MTDRFIASLEQLAKFVVLAAAAGYISLRAHHNYLGIPLRVSPGTEVYLAESYVFLVAMVAILVQLALVVVPVAVLVVGTASLARRASQWSAAIRRVAAHPAWGWAALVVALATTFVLIGQIGTLSDVAVGSLSASELRPRAAWVFPAAVWASAAMLASAAYALRCAEAPAARQPWQGILVTGTILTLFLPLLFGSLAHPLLYPKAEIVRAGAPLECGLLILHNEDRTILWRAEGGAGMVQIYPTGSVMALRLGELQDLRVQALFASERAEGRPTCNIPTPVG